MCDVSEGTDTESGRSDSFMAGVLLDRGVTQSERRRSLESGVRKTEEPARPLLT